MSIKVLVIGNCQARPVANLLARGVSDLEIIDVVILHLSRENEKNYHISLMERSDLILSQHTSKSFEPSHLSSIAVSSSFPNKTVIWPNIFYSGQQPYLRYVTLAGGARAMGPFDAYHDLRIMSDWYLSRGLECNLPLHEPQYMHSKSILELKKKEDDCDVRISDVIEDRYQSHRLFFTFNHPAILLLDVLTARLAQALGMSYRAEALPDREPLGRIIVPSVWHEGGEDDWILSGPKIDPTAVPMVQPGAPVAYAIKEAHSLAMKCYDRQQEALRNLGSLRFTPSYPL